MTITINHLKNRQAQLANLEVAFGKVIASGDTDFSYSLGSGAALQMYGYNSLGEGEWNRCLGAWYAGMNLPESEYHFHAGAHATGMTTGPQTVDSWFPNDVPHSRRAAIGFRAPLGFGDADTEKNPPTEFFGLFETKKVPDFNPSGVQTDFSYSPNGARCLSELFMRFGRIPNLPSIYQNFVDYWKRRIDWGCWTEWRDYQASLEMVDYTTIEDLEGFGLTAKYFNDATFTQLVERRIEPLISIDDTDKAQAVGLNTNAFGILFEGKMKFHFSETYTFWLSHSGGAKLYINNVAVIDSAAATTNATGTFNATANQFYDVRLEYVHAGGNVNLKLEGEAPSTPRQIVPANAFYPKPEMQPRYENHFFLPKATNFSTAMSQILFLSNSIRQDVNGKLRFFCLEQITPAFEFNSSNIIEGSFDFATRDIFQNDPVTEYEAVMRDLESRFLEEPTTPVSVGVDWLTNKPTENVKVVDVGNNTRWRALKILKFRSRLEMATGISCSFDGIGARTYPPMPGSLVTINHRKIGTPKTFLVGDAINKSSTDGTIPNRKFTVQEWQ